MLRRVFALMTFFGAITVSGTMLVAQSPGEISPDAYPVPDFPSYTSVETSRTVYENEDQKFSIPFSWDIEPGMDEEFRYAGSAAYRSGAKSSPQGAPAIVPEPGTMVLMAAGLAALAVRRMRISA